MKILLIASIVGKAGVDVITKKLPELQRLHGFSLVIGLAEFSRIRLTLSQTLLEKLFDSGLDYLHLGNPILNQKAMAMIEYFNGRVIPPLNHPAYLDFPTEFVISHQKNPLTLLNYCGREGLTSVTGSQSLHTLDCPFNLISNRLDKSPEKSLRLVTFYSHSTQEKQTFAHWIDGRADLLTGFGQYVSTADCRRLPGGLYLHTDGGFTGATGGVGGLTPESLIPLYQTIRPTKFNHIETPGQIHGTIMELPGGVSAFSS
jgi:hypothetical protein